MANAPYNGNQVNLWLKLESDTYGDYKLAVCSTTLTLNQTSNEIDASSKCGDYFLPGIIEGELSVTLQMLSDAADTGTIGAREIAQWFEDKLNIAFRITDDITTPVLEDLSGVIVITSMDRTWSSDEVASADFTFKIQGSVIDNLAV